MLCNMASESNQMGFLHNGRLLLQAIVRVCFGVKFVSGVAFFAAVGAAAVCIHLLVELKEIEEMASSVPRALRALACFIYGIEAVLIAAFLITVCRLVIDTWRRAKQAA
jgi:hypothetical protein